MVDLAEPTVVIVNLILGFVVIDSAQGTGVNLEVLRCCGLVKY